MDRQTPDRHQTDTGQTTVKSFLCLKQELVDFSSSNAFSIANLSEGAQRRFVSSTIYRKSFKLIDVSVPNKNKMCDASQLAANEHKCLIKSNTSVFQLKQELVDFSPSISFSIAALQVLTFATLSELPLLFSFFQIELRTLHAARLVPTIFLKATERMLRSSRDNSCVLILANCFVYSTISTLKLGIQVGLPSYRSHCSANLLK